MLNSTPYTIDIQSKLALFLSVLGFVCIVLLPFNGLFPGMLMIVYSIYLSNKVGGLRSSNDRIKISLFLCLASLAFIIAIGIMYISIIYF